MNYLKAGQMRNLKNLLLLKYWQTDELSEYVTLTRSISNTPASSLGLSDLASGEKIEGKSSNTRFSLSPNIMQT